MATTQFGTDNKSGVDFNATYAPYNQAAAQSSTNDPSNVGPPVAPGTYVQGSGESQYVLVYASGTVNMGDVVQLSTTYTAVSVTSTLASFGSQLGVAQVTIPAGNYGWVQRCGFCQKIGTNAAAVNNVQLATTTGAGLIDDATTTGTKNITGMVLAASAGSSTITTAILNYPVVGTTN